ncbi:MAG: hypothetical protein L0287_06350 [Anaerolineae bacterium]|nr:hypothetical protein [Anaerolineae bacterium]MCI0608011.1 hypothetical protein [Anaerolineae bacterium]
MNTMKGFYASISSTSQLQGPYQEALAKITRINRKQTNALMSNLGWQDW